MAFVKRSWQCPAAESASWYSMFLISGGQRVGSSWAQESEFALSRLDHSLQWGCIMMPNEGETSMCRNIKKLRYPDRQPTDEELQLAALQFVRKVSGYRQPSRANEVTFQQAVDEVAAATKTLFKHLNMP